MQLKITIISEIAAVTAVPGRIELANAVVPVCHALHR